MNLFEKIVSFLKLPFKVIVLIAIILGLLLFLPKNLQTTLRLDEFVVDYGKYLGITFLFAVGYIVFIFFSYLIKKIRLSQINKKYIENIKKELPNLPALDRYLLREFFLQSKSVIEVPMENTEFVDLFNKHILIITSKNARGYIFGTFVAVAINPLIKEYITPELLGLPTSKFTNQQIEKIKSERPLFVSQISYINNLFNFPWMGR